MTDRPATAAGRELLATLDPYNREDEWTHRRVSDILAIEEQARAELRSQVERLREDIQGVLDDAESQHPGGWGPDVTTVAILRTLLADTAKAPEEWLAAHDAEVLATETERLNLGIRALDFHNLAGRGYVRRSDVLALIGEA